jgi:hypothetical protein
LTAERIHTMTSLARATFTVRYLLTSLATIAFGVTLQ